MTPRSQLKLRLAAVMLLAGGSLITIGGCDPRALFFFLQPDNPSIEAPGPDLLEKKVVILCNVSANAVGEFPSLERDICREVAKLFRTKVKKITVVDPDKVATWIEAHPKWSDPSDAARDFDADLVIFLEIEEFRIQSPGDLNVLQGASKTHIQVFEMQYPKNSKDKPIKDQPKEAHNIYEAYCESTFPNRGPIPVDSGTSPSAFKNKFLRIAATEISWHFVKHAPDDSIQDSRIEK
ncbi:MAG: hypothetical protein ACLQIB_01385 [Isosphaeraceae bacterium]